MKNNTDSTNKQKKLFVFITALLLSLAILAVPFTGITIAKANEVIPDNPTFEHDKLFWFSDNADSQTDFNQLVSAFPQIDMEMYYRPQDVFCNRFLTDFSAAQFSDVEDAYVIFELRSGINDWVSEDGCALYDVFEYFKGNNCKIMFICGTDELRFYKQNDFLDFVDIHINTDLLTTFLSNIFYNVQLDYGDTKIQNVTFFIDSYFSEGIEDGYLNCWFFKNYLMSFIRSVYREEIEFQFKKNYEILRENNIKIICNLADGTYYDAAYGRVRLSGVEELGEYISNEWFYAIGSTRNGYIDSQEWYDFADDLTAYFGLGKSKIYVYNEAQYPFYNSSVYTQGSGSGLLPQIMSDFIYGNSLTRYNNWAGRCEVTYKDVLQGEGGWMLCFGIPEQDSSFAELNPYLAFLDSWQIALSTEIQDGHEISDDDYYNSYFDDNGPPAIEEETD